MSDILTNITTLRQQIPSSVKLVAVSKTRPVGDILVAYSTGLRSFGENRVQELLSKKDQLPADIEWHLVGHLQTNKVKSVVPFISMIQSVDSFRLLKVINTEASRVSRIVKCLLQIFIASEESKFGFSMEELHDMFDSGQIAGLKNVMICGVMGMATFTENSEQVSGEFRYLKRCFDTLKNDYMPGNTEFREISMGMSGDYKLAIVEGSTLVRIGSLIFGQR